jgi:hypothetical protein
MEELHLFIFLPTKCAFSTFLKEAWWVEKAVFLGSLRSIRTFGAFLTAKCAPTAHPIGRFGGLPYAKIGLQFLTANLF